MHKKILQIALPMIVSNLTAPILGLVDTAVLGHLSSAQYLAGAGVGVAIINMLLWGMGFLRMSTTGIVAQKNSAGHREHVKSTVIVGLLLAISMGLVLLVFQHWLIPFLLHVMDARHNIAVQAHVFLSVIFWGLPFAMANFVLIGALIGLSRPKVVLLITICMNLLGIFLDIFLVVVLGYKTAGVATATAASYILGAMLGFYFLTKTIKLTISFEALKLAFNKVVLKNFFVLNRDVFIRTLCLIFVFTYFTRAGIFYGQNVLAANIVLMNFFTFFAFAADGFANAAEVLVGEAVGHQNHQMLRVSIESVAKWALGIAVFFVLIYGVFSSWIIGHLTNLTAVHYLAHSFRGWVIVLPIVAVWGFLFDGIFVGATLSREMRNTMIVSLFCFLVARLLTLHMGNQGLWLSFLLFLLVRGVSMFITLIKSSIIHNKAAIKH